MSNIALISEIPHRRQEDAWLEANREEAFDTIRELIDSKDTWLQAAESLLLMLPRLVNHPDFKRWGRLTEYAFKHSPYFLTNGFDGKPTIEFASDFVFQKSEAPKQLPTKTIRRKRILTHHTQVLEIYLIILVGKYFNRTSALDADLIQEIIEFARSINQPDLNAKLYQVLAYIYMYREVGDKTVRLGELSYHYYVPLNNHLEAAQSAYVVALGYQIKKDYQQCIHWANIAADEFARTNYRSQYCSTSLLTSSTYIYIEDYESGIQWAEQGLNEAHLLQSDHYSGYANIYIGLSQTYLKNWAEAEKHLLKAREHFEVNNNIEELAHLELNIAFLEAKRRDFNDAKQRLNAVLETFNQMPESGWKDQMVASAHRLFDHIEADTVDLIRPSSS